MSNDHSKRPRVPGDKGFDSEFKDAIWKDAEYDSETYRAYLQAGTHPAPGRVSSSASDYANSRLQQKATRQEPRPPVVTTHPTVGMFGGVLEPSTEVANTSALSVFDRATAAVGAAVPYRTEMEKKFGTSFGDVESFTGRNELRDAGANAAAKKNKIAFVSNEPSAAQVGHELTHVVQQRNSAIDSVAASRDVSEPNDPAEREAEAVAASIVECGLRGPRVMVNATPTARLHLDRGAVDVVSSAGVDTTSKVDVVSGADKQTKSAFNLPRNAVEAHRYLEDVVVRKGLDGIDNVIAQIQVSSESKPPIGDTSSHLLGRDPEELSTALTLLRNQANVVKRKAYQFIRSFKSNVKDGAVKLLDVSEAEIASVLGQYGLKAAAASKIMRSSAGLLMRGGNERTAEMVLMEGAAVRRDAPKNPSAPDFDTQNQADLFTVSRELQTEWATKVKPLLHFLENQKPKPTTMGFRGLNRQTPEFDLTGMELPVELYRPDLEQGAQLKLVKEALRKEKNSFTEKWLKHERKHPLLVMYRDNKGAPSDLGELQQGREEQQRAIVRCVLPKLRDIYRTRWAVRDGKVDPLKLPAAVQMTKRSMQVRPKSMQDRLATDEMMNALDGDWKDWAILAVGLGLGILAAIPTGGSSVVLGAELAGLALELYLFDERIDEYTFHKSASNTNLDKARALSQREPSLTGLVVDLLSVGLGVAAVAKVVDSAVALKTAVRSGNLPRARVIRDGLNDLGNRHGIKNTGGRIYDDALGDPTLARDLRQAQGSEYDLSVRSRDDLAGAAESSRASSNPLRITTGEKNLTNLGKFVPADMEGFELWFDSLTRREFDEVWADASTKTQKGARELIADGIRHKGFLNGLKTAAGGKHEWLMVSRARKIKRWGVSMKLVHEARTLTERTVGRGFRHVSRHGPGHGTMHQELAAMIDVSETFLQFKRQLNDWADIAMPPHGRAHLPLPLQLRIAE